MRDSEQGQGQALARSLTRLLARSRQRERARARECRKRARCKPTCQSIRNRDPRPLATQRDQRERQAASAPSKSDEGPTSSAHHVQNAGGAAGLLPKGWSDSGEQAEKSEAGASTGGRGKLSRDMSQVLSYIHTYTHTYTHTHTHTHTSTHAHTHARAHTHTHNICVRGCTYIL
jgi:hypothetical protein